MMTKLIIALLFLVWVILLIPMAILFTVAVPIEAIMNCILKGSIVHVVAMKWAIDTMKDTTKLSLSEYIDKELG